MTDKLKPCPFCGGEALLHDEEYKECGIYWVGCFNADCKMHPVTADYTHEESAVAAWNGMTAQAKQLTLF